MVEETDKQTNMDDKNRDFEGGCSIKSITL